MSTKTRIRSLVVAVVYVVSMIVSTQAALAVNNSTLTFTVIPGVGGGNAQGTTGTVKLNCGWHSSCKSPYPLGTGVDWGSGTTGAAKVYLRAKVTDSLLVGSKKMLYARVFPGTFSGGCRQILAEIRTFGDDPYSSADNQLLMTLRFMHATTPTTGTTYYNFYASKEGIISGFEIGSLVNDSAGGCGWTGYHLHSDQSPVSGIPITRNTGEIPNAAPACPPDTGACNTFKTGGTSWSPPSAHWERKVSWTYCYSGCPL